MALFNNTPMQPTVAELEELISSEREAIQSGRGIASKPQQVSASKEDLVLGFFNDIFGATQEKAEAVREEIAPDMEEMARRSVVGAVPTSVRPMARPDPLATRMFDETTDAPKVVEEPAPVTAEELESEGVASADVDAAVAEALEEPAATDGGGLMSRRLDEKGKALPITELRNYTDNYAEVYLTEHEGLKPHKSLEGGKDTAALGVKFSLGLKRSDYKSDAEFAGAVALKHRDKAKAKFGEDKWANLPESVKFAMTDLNYNTGTIGSSGDKEDTTAAMKNTLDFVGMTTKAGEKASLISLAKRRAWNWNKAASDIGESEIAKIKQIPTSTGGTKFEYLDEDDNVVHSTTTTRKPVKLDNSGKATVLTTTREMDM